MTSASDQPPAKKKQPTRPARLLSFRKFCASRRSKSRDVPFGAGGALGMSSGVVEPVGGPGQQSGGSEVVVNHVVL